MTRPLNVAQVKESEINWLSRTDKPRVGDFIFTLERELRRFTYDWDDSLQITAFRDGGHNPFFFLCRNGYADFSGSLDPSIPLEKIKLTNHTRLGKFWCFDEGWPGAHRGRTFYLPCRIYRQIE